jgi:hypothetical protein
LTPKKESVTVAQLEQKMAEKQSQANYLTEEIAGIFPRCPHICLNPNLLERA